MNNLNYDLSKYIPGGSHTYSKGADQYLDYCVPTASWSRGPWVKDTTGIRYLDWPMGNRVICLGHANRYVNDRVKWAIDRGTNHTFPSELELAAAKYFVDDLGLGEMVKFGKNGSDAVSAAIRLTRAYTGREKVAFCLDQPFYAIHDWFIGSTPSNAGVDMNTQKNVLRFRWNDISSVEELIEKNKGQIACLLLEVCKFEAPSQDFIDFVNNIRDKYGIYVIADENINCMKFGIAGAHRHFGLDADLVCYGKAISNGFSFSMLSGPSYLMKLGGCREELPKVFLLSQTHSSEASGIAAAMATCQFYTRHNVDKHIERMGYLLKEHVNRVISDSHLHQKIWLGGIDQNPTWVVSPDLSELDSLRLRAWLVKELMNRGVLAGWFTLTYAHKPRHIDMTCKSLKRLLDCSSELDYTLIDPSRLPKPVFRRMQNWSKAECRDWL